MEVALPIAAHIAYLALGFVCILGAIALLRGGASFVQSLPARIVTAPLLLLLGIWCAYRLFDRF